MKKKHILRKAAALLLAGAMLTGTATAEKNSKISLEEFVTDSVRTSLELEEYPYGTYSISNLIPVYNFETSDLCNYKTFVMSGSKIVGEMDVWKDEAGGYISIFSDEVDETINMFTDGKQSICYGICDGKMWLCANYMELYEIDFGENEDKNEQRGTKEDTGCNDNSETAFNSYSAQYEKSKTLLMCKRVDLALFETSESVVFNEQTLKEPTTISNASKASIALDVVHVGNACEPGSIEPNLCWAACVAMKTNYIYRNAINYSPKDAIDVYNYLVDNNLLYDGSVDCVKSAYNAFGISVGGGYVSVKNYGIWNTLDAGHPVDVSLKGITSSGRESYHQVLIYGMRKATTGLGYLINCPNKRTSNGKKVVSVSGKVDELMNKYLETVPYFDDWTYSNGTTINYNNVQRIYYTKNTL